MKGLDSNILLRYLTEDDPIQFSKARRLIEGCSESDPGYLPLVSIVECVWTLSRTYKLANRDLVNILDTLLGDGRFVLQNEREVFLSTRELEQGFDFADALIHALSETAGCSATYTFDRKAARLPGFRLL